MQINATDIEPIYRSKTPAIAPKNERESQNAGGVDERKGFPMYASSTRPVAIDPLGSANVCANCDARPHSVCNAVPDSEISRLAAIAMVTHAEPGTTFIQEGDPATHFFNDAALEPMDALLTRLDIELAADRLRTERKSGVSRLAAE